MSPASDSTPPRVTQRLLPILCAALVLAAALWALAPLDAPAFVPVTQPHKKDAAEEREAPELVTLDRSAFSAPLWLSPPLPQPPPPPAAAAAPPPFKLQLLAIIKEDAGAEAGTSGVTYKAMVYDPDSDKVLVVAGGDTLGGRLIESIDRTALKIRDAKGGAPRVLTLKTEGGTR